MLLNNSEVLEHNQVDFIIFIMLLYNQVK